MQTMELDIVIVREGENYRLLHGHLRLANLLNADGEAWVEVIGGDRVHIVQAHNGYLVSSGAKQLPLLRI
jgi:hypothetical protein